MSYQRETDKKTTIKFIIFELRNESKIHNAIVAFKLGYMFHLYILGEHEWFSGRVVVQ